METGAALLLGVVQGLTEFVPVSSSGHLALGRALLPGDALSSPGVLFEVVVHLGTLAAALIFLRREIFALLRSLFPRRAPDDTSASAGRRLIGRLLVASAPAGVVGVVFAEQIRAAFDGTAIAAAGLVLTGSALLAFSKRGHDQPRGRNAGSFASIPTAPRSVAGALSIGAAQALAVLPGISRSGFTILAGQRHGLPPGEAARFSFLLSAPVIAGAAVVEGASALAGNAAPVAATGLIAVELTAGFVAAFVAGTLALRWVFAWLARRRFHQFGWYCLLAGGIGLGLSSA